MKAIVSIAMIALSVTAKQSDVKIVRPLMHASVGMEQSAEADAFMNGLSAKCPEGTKATDAKHLFRQGMNYKDTFNAVAQIECR